VSLLAPGKPFRKRRQDRCMVVVIELRENAAEVVDAERKSEHDL
jgi:hypothetical protein